MFRELATFITQPHLERAFDGLDLVAVHFYSCLLGVFLCIATMQLLSNGTLKFIGECPASFWARRAALALLALSFCWAMIYVVSKDWQPWPPDLLIIAALDLMLSSGIVVAFRRHGIRSFSAHAPTSV